MEYKLAAIMMALLIRHRHLAGAATTDGVNAGIFPTLCAALQLGDGKITIDPPILPEPDKPTTLFNLNMTLSEVAWRDTFLQKSEDGKRLVKKAPIPTLTGEWKDKWDTWATAAEAAANTETNEQIRKTTGIAEATAAQLEAIKPEITALAEAAFEAYNQLQKAVETPKDDTTITEKLRLAICGQNKIPTEDDDVAKAFTATANSPQAGCDDEATAPATKSLLGAILCVCATTNAGSHKLCNARVAAVKWEQAAVPKATAVTAIRNFCPVRAAQKLTGHQIRQAIQQLTTLLHGSNSDTYIGQPGATCDGSTAGACIKYTGAAKSGAPNLDKIAWIAQLNSAADDIEARGKHNQKTETIKNELNRAEKLALKIAAHAKNRQTATETSGALPKQQTETSCDAAKDDEKTCKKLEDKGCVFNKDGEKGKKCTLSEDAKKAAEKEAKENQGGNDGKK
uniref:Variant surface glycoprotein n=1 Tax=Trypanosoma brucei TaxID=5691 RepID=A0A1V0FZ88_9TRYP|nr:variant surface glycoprotein [Trypanosoma brucei]